MEETYVPKRSPVSSDKESCSEQSSESGTENEKSEAVESRIKQSVDGNSPREHRQRQYPDTLYDITNDKTVETKRSKNSQYVNDDKWIKNNVERQNSRNDRESQNTKKISDIRNKFEEPKKAEKPTPAKRTVDPHRTAKSTNKFSEIQNRWESDEPKDSRKQTSSEIPERNNNFSSASVYYPSSNSSNATSRVSRKLYNAGFSHSPVLSVISLCFSYFHLIAPLLKTSAPNNHRTSINQSHYYYIITQIGARWLTDGPTSFHLSAN